MAVINIPKAKEEKVKRALDVLVRQWTLMLDSEDPRIVAAAQTLLAAYGPEED